MSDVEKNLNEDQLKEAAGGFGGGEAQRISIARASTTRSATSVARTAARSSSIVIDLKCFWHKQSD